MGEEDEDDTGAEKEPADQGAQFDATPDKMLAELIGKAWVKEFELRNLDYEEFLKHDEPQHVAARLVLQRVEEPYEEVEYDASGKYLGEAVEMLLAQFRADFP